MNDSPIPSGLVAVKRALISVSDKTGLIEAASALAAMGVELVSTGGTARAMREAGLAVRDVAELTGFAEMMDGRVKTLHPKVHGGLLALRDDPEHVAAMSAHGIEAIDLLVCNLYPFEATVAAGADYETCVENIDIGGPAMIRAAAKNHGHVAVVVETDDLAALIETLKANGGASDLATRRRLAGKAYARTAAYDAAVSSWFAEQLGEPFPQRLAFAGEKAMEMRYGENPHQRAAYYRAAGGGVADAEVVQGKALSYNNINDTDAAFALVGELDQFGKPACAIIKHANPCGAALGDNLAEAYRAAYACDTTSAFGGIVALNRPLDVETAQEVLKIFTEVVIAPDASDEVRALFAAKKNLRLLIADGVPDPQRGGRVIRQVLGGYLVQDADTGHLSPDALKVVTKRAPSEVELSDLLFAWRVAKHVKSNAIVYAKGGATVGVGAGQMSRLDSTRIAARKAQDMAEGLGLAEPTTRGSVVASDAFFPFADGLLAAAEAGATAIIQPGGSIRDDEVIAAADEAGLAMVFTGMRHFRH
ncbi:MAG: bifunctional phosphoribosylaminoimidazolecarboxamide formyltransferase/IMP cyclohydrolase [Neomegalonema sp.]|nr:bifunctional phosphoribosylaminoimidazolecarboxamide formyltransferase/IMP cyclohydrolase [Neomegalonema sp.]